MSNNKNGKIVVTSPKRRRLRLLVSFIVLVLACMSSLAGGSGYEQLNLVSDLPGVALLQDTNLVNAWGVSFSSASPFWVSDNGAGKATLYAVTNDSQGEVHIGKVP